MLHSFQSLAWSLDIQRKLILSVDLNASRDSKGGASVGDDKAWCHVSGKLSVSEDKKVME